MFLLNGQPADNISLLDRSIYYGDGVFETIAVAGGKPLCWDAHLKRLASGCKKIRISVDDLESIKSEAEHLCQDIDRAVLKIVVTSGTSGRGYRRGGAKPNRLLAIYPWPDYSRKLTGAARIRLCSTRLGHNCELAGIKHLNRLEQVLARCEWEDDDIIEGLMLDIHGNAIAGTMSNLFVAGAGKELRTPDTSFCGINGIIRQYILEHSTSFGYQIEVCELSLNNVYRADEIFFCNSIIGILPVGQLGDHYFSSQRMALEIKEELVTRGVITS